VMVGQSLEKLNPNTQDFYISQQLAQTYAQLVRRRPVLTGAAQALGLEYVPSAANIITRQIQGTQLMEISFNDTNPERARALADEIANQLILLTPASGTLEERGTFVQDELNDLEAKIKSTRQEIESEQAKLEAASSARAIQQYQGNIGALQQKLNNYQATYASLLGTVQGAANYIAIVEHATTPRWPISPNVRQTVMLAAAIGLGLAVGGAFLIEFLDDTIRSADEATRLTGLPLVGTIIKISENNGYAEKLITKQQPFSPVSEAFRVLRTNIGFSAIDEPIKTLAITSAGPSEGKSVTLANLGVVFAEMGRRTLIVDTDLRRPVQHEILGVSNGRGLCDAMLDADADILEYIQDTSVEHLSLLAAGQLPPNPSEILASERFGRIIETLKGRTDVILFDSPPVLLVADAAILGTRVDGVLLVTDRGLTRRAMARTAAEELRRVHANLRGVVLNHAVPSGVGYHYFYHYYSRQDGEEAIERSASLKRLPNLLGRWLRRGKSSRKGERSGLAHPREIME
jgi:polysaccharide biosynthesis transport protein